MQLGRAGRPSTFLPEACYLLGEHLGRRAELALAKALAAGELTVVHFTAADLSRCVELLETCADASIGFVDASVAAIAERLGIREPYTLLPQA